MHIAIVHDTVGQKDAPDAKDVLAQADAVAGALRHLGHTHFRAEISLDMATLVRTLSNGGADLVFNLVESIGGKGRLIHLLPYCLDAVPLPYTGAPAQAMLLTSNKTMAKKWMETSAIATPAWIGPFPGGNGKGRFGSADKSTWIVKSVWEHASIGLGPESIVKNLTADAAYAALAGRAPALGGACFAEAFVDGREFNLSLLTGPDGPEVLPPAEIIFDGYTADMPRIVDYRAKWDEAAYEFHHTPRQFDFDTTDGDLLERLKTIALDCWHGFGLAGYARVDFRVAADGTPFVLEINTNPCIAPDAGFAAALTRAGIAFEDAVARIIAGSFR
ncbi:DdlB1: D-alanine--D-alanine ligase [Desulfosarcina variabilis str. Montpellier]|uniref:D-alanine--D-alanine ligase family protein n=1 Tax=Desulfosarcina variabilis TaxID=2300 RepID=UPI003AFB0460